MLRGQSAQRSWFFIQHARIGAVHANVSIALTSSILAARAGGEPAALPPGAPAPAPGGSAPGGAGGAPAAGAGLFSRLIGASGFQLVRGPTLPYPYSWCAAGRRTGRWVAPCCPGPPWVPDTRAGLWFVPNLYPSGISWCGAWSPVLFRRSPPLCAADCQGAPPSVTAGPAETCGEQPRGAAGGPPSSAGRRARERARSGAQPAPRCRRDARAAPRRPGERDQRAAEPEGVEPGHAAAGPQGAGRQPDATLLRPGAGGGAQGAHRPPAPLAPCPAPATPAGWYVSNAARLDQAVSARARTAALGRARRPRDANRPIW